MTPSMTSAPKKSFILCLATNDRHMLAVLLAESFWTRQNMGVVDAACEAGSIVGYSDKTVPKLRKEFFENKGFLKERREGKYERLTIYHDEELNEKAAKWVRENAFAQRQTEHDCPIFLPVGERRSSPFF